MQVRKLNIPERADPLLLTVSKIPPKIPATRTRFVRDFTTQMHWGVMESFFVTMEINIILGTFANYSIKNKSTITFSYKSASVRLYVLFLSVS